MPVATAVATRITPSQRRMMGTRPFSSTGPSKAMVGRSPSGRLRVEGAVRTRSMDPMGFGSELHADEGRRGAPSDVDAREPEPVGLRFGADDAALGGEAHADAGCGRRRRRWRRRRGRRGRRWRGGRRQPSCWRRSSSDPAISRSRWSSADAVEERVVAGVAADRQALGRHAAQAGPRRGGRLGRRAAGAGPDLGDERHGPRRGAGCRPAP